MRTLIHPTTFVASSAFQASHPTVDARNSVAFVKTLLFFLGAFSLHLEAATLTAPAGSHGSRPLYGLASSNAGDSQSAGESREDRSSRGEQDASPSPAFPLLDFFARLVPYASVLLFGGLLLRETCHPSSLLVPKEKSPSARSEFGRKKLAPPEGGRVAGKDDSNS